MIEEDRTLASESDSKKVEIPYSVAKTLLESKIKELRDRVNEILDIWDQKDVEVFQNLTREGKIPEAEMDAIRIGNIIESLSEFEEIYSNL
ncbi:MAG: hypothetical protein HeimC2_05090 [Candidatus Heimdallarchaeota archaeon LC_2]|nr:MAG: hypothetical protein HeimC2_05090 [Candidatus Heimdallarchaeota archaeon LC_2]